MATSYCDKESLARQQKLKSGTPLIATVHALMTSAHTVYTAGLATAGGVLLRASMDKSTSFGV